MKQADRYNARVAVLVGGSAAPVGVKDMHTGDQVDVPGGGAEDVAAAVRRILGGGG
jgi:hypothetical protein